MGVKALAVSFGRTQRAEGRAAATIKLYGDCVGRLARHIESEAGTDDLAGLTRRAITDYLAARSATCQRSTVSIDFRALHVFMRWLVDEGELPSNPMERIKPPRVPVVPVPGFSEPEIKALIAACEGTGLRARRDMAMLRLLLDCGLRLSELSGLRFENVDLDQSLVTVSAKGRTRVVSYGAKTAMSIDRWLRLQARRKPVAPRDSLWGGMTRSGVYQALKGRAVEAGVEGFYIHRCRHDWATRWLKAGGSEGSLMKSAGWSSVSMVYRYSAASAEGRARDEQRSLALGDRF